MSKAPVFGDLDLVKELYERTPFTSGFDPSAPNDGPSDAGVPISEKSGRLNVRESMERALLHKVVGGASLDEIKAAGLGYVDTDSDPSPKPGARRLRRYWTRGPGALKIRWGTAGDFKRCVRQLREHVGPGAEGLCNVYHRSATGHAPGQGPHSGKSEMVADIETKNLVVESDMLRLENLFLSKSLFEGWERVESKGTTYDVGYNVLTEQWEAHEAKNFSNVITAADEEAILYKTLNALPQEN